MNRFKSTPHQVWLCRAMYVLTASLTVAFVVYAKYEERVVTPAAILGALMLLSLVLLMLSVTYANIVRRRHLRIEVDGPLSIMRPPYYVMFYKGQPFDCFIHDPTAPITG